MKKLSLTLLALILGSAAARADHFIGNGSDTEPYTSGIAWFSASKPIVACLERAPEFPLSSFESKQLLEKAFQTWYAYMDTKGTYLPLNPLTVRESCSGQEDLVLFLGVNNAATDAAKKKYLNPAAFAELVQYDDQKYWGQGFIWMAPSSTAQEWNEERFFAILLHEVGHVLGCSHVDGTIMDAKIESLVFQPTNKALTRYYSLIDWNHELVTCKRCSKKWTWQWDSLPGRLSGAKDRLLKTGWMPGPVTVTLEQKNPFSHGDLASTLVLTYKWDNQTRSYPIQFDALWGGDPTSGIYQFKKLQPGHDFTGRTHYASTFIGSLKDPIGGDKLVLLSYNDSPQFFWDDKASEPVLEGPVRLYLLENSSTYPAQTLIFSAPAWSVEFKKL